MLEVPPNHRSGLLGRLLNHISAPPDSAGSSVTNSAESSRAEVPAIEVAFQQLALEVFAHQFAQNLPYRRYCEGRGVSPGTVTSWLDIPPVPTDVFKYVDLFCGTTDEAARVFQTSGTTRGGEQRGRHFFRTLELYEAAILPAFDAMFLPDGIRPRALSLIAPEEELPDSSLSHMVSYLFKTRFAAESLWGWQSGQLNLDSIEAWLKEHEAHTEPVLILGTAFSWVHLFDERPHLRVTLPPGSRLMETGGFKGRTREVSREELYGLFERQLGIQSSHCISEYGMTELSSQLYDNGLSLAFSGSSGPRGLRAPHWLKVAVVDPMTLAPLPDGQVGLVRFFDLANLDSVSAVQTADRGILREGTLTLLGRAPVAEARGCSLSAEEVLRVAPHRGAV